MQATAGGDERWVRRRARRVATAVACGLALIALEPVAQTHAATVPAPTIGTTQSIPAATTLNDVACATATTCYAVGTGSDADGNVDGVVVPITNGIAGTPAAVPGGGSTELGLSAITCPSATTCYAVGAELAPVADTDSGADVVTITDGAPAAAVPAAPSSDDEDYAMFNDIACTSASTCIAVGEETTSDGSVSDGATDLISNGVPGTLQDDPAVQELDGVFCSGTTCQAAGAIGNADGITTSGALVALSVAGVPAAPQTVGSLAGFGLGACPSTGSCLVLGYTGDDAADEVLVPIAGTTAGTPAVAPDLLGLTCASAVSCVGVGATDDGTGVATEIANGVPGTPVNDVDPNVDGLLAVACGSATSCDAVGVGDENQEGVVVPITLPAIAAAPAIGTGTGTGPAVGPGRAPAAVRGPAPRRRAPAPRRPAPGRKRAPGAGRRRRAPAPAPRRARAPRPPRT